MKLKQALDSISGLHSEYIEKAQARLDSLTKPLGSLGRLEDIVKQIVGIRGEVFPKVDKKTVVILCADNGVLEEGVSSCPKSVTSSVTQNFTKGFTGINVLTRHSGADICVVDIGVDDDIDCQGIINRKIRKGTWNIAKGPAMTREEAILAIETGIEMMGTLKERGTNLFGTGEMGIGNTTTSSAIAAVLTKEPLAELVGRGAGLTSEAPSIPSVKDMPAFDPDAEITALTLTIPSWASSINRTRTNTDFDRVSNYAKDKLMSTLIVLQHTISKMLSVIKEEE